MHEPELRLDQYGRLPCERWTSVPWYECLVGSDWLVYVADCQLHPSGCVGHGFCVDHLVALLGNPEWRKDLAQMSRIYDPNTSIMHQQVLKLPVRAS